METHSHNNNEDNSASWSCATNWTIAHGSLDTSLTFETSDSPVESEAVDSTRRSPLVLKPPSPDSGPCEIKLSFKQKHEIRQVYVRSTARVYEIYFAPTLQSSNEYLCTVRCSIAARKEELLHGTDIEESACAKLKGSNGELAEEKITAESNIGTNEDDWIEVKVLDSPQLDNDNTLLPQKTDSNPRVIKDLPDFYEATAEINDADPCMSLTLRLLSLRSKGCVYVDEVYVFADPVESADSENKPVEVGNSAGNSLMAMLVPTLLQLSKSGVGRMQDKHASDKMERRDGLEIGLKTTNSTKTANGMQPVENFCIADWQNVKFQESNMATAESPQVQAPSEVSARDKSENDVDKDDLPYCRIERVLEQLVSRVSRIEELCMRFEENMLTPLNSMEARLKRVEQQVETLAKSSQHAGLHSCTRISAPEFSCNESSSSSFYNDGSDCHPDGASELEKEDFPSDKLSNPPYDTSISLSAPQFLPSLVVTAPEFSSRDDEEDNDVFDQSKSSQEKKQAVSIDDALAAALAGFLSTNVKPSNYTRTLSVRAPEFTSEENGDGELSMDIQTSTVTAPELTSEKNDTDEKITSSSIPNEKPVVLFGTLGETNGNGCTNHSVLTSIRSSSMAGAGKAMRILEDVHSGERSEGIDFQNGKSAVPSDASVETNGNGCTNDSVLVSNSSSMGCAEQAMSSLNDIHYEETSSMVNGKYQFYEGVTGCHSQATSVDCPPAQAKHDLARTDDDQLAEKIGRHEASTRITDDSIYEKTEIVIQFLENKAEDNFNPSAVASTAVVQGSDKDMVQNVSKPPCAASAVNFEIPILDVKFATWESSSTKSPLEALLTDVAELDVETPRIQQSDNHVAIGEQSNLFVVEDEEPFSPVTNNHFLVELELAEFDVETPRIQESDNHVAIGEQINLIVVEDEEPFSPVTNNHLLVELDGYDVELVSNSEGDVLQNHRQEMFGSLI